MQQVCEAVERLEGAGGRMTALLISGWSVAVIVTLRSFGVPWTVLFVGALWLVAEVSKIIVGGYEREINRAYLENHGVGMCRIGGCDICSGGDAVLGRQFDK